MLSRGNIGNKVHVPVVEEYLAEANPPKNPPCCHSITWDLPVYLLWNIWKSICRKVLLINICSLIERNVATLHYYHLLLNHKAISYWIHYRRMHGSDGMGLIVVHVSAEKLYENDWIAVEEKPITMIPLPFASIATGIDFRIIFGGLLQKVPVALFQVCVDHSETFFRM